MYEGPERCCQPSASPTASVWRPGETRLSESPTASVWRPGETRLSTTPTASVWRPEEAVNFLSHLQPVYEGPERLSTFCVTYSQCMKVGEAVNFLRHLHPVYEGLERLCMMNAGEWECRFKCVLLLNVYTVGVNSIYGHELLAISKLL